MDTSDERLGDTLKQLIPEKKNGELDLPVKFTNQETKWRDALDYAVLEKCITHRSHEIRRDVVELLVISKKSTQRFIKIELDLIQKFLIYNLGERIDFVPLIKKALKRARDSLIVLRRQLVKAEKIEILEDSLESLPTTNGKFEADVEDMSAMELKCLIQDYEEFLITLHITCIDNLYPTANYERRRSSLQILCHMKDILDVETINLRWDESKAKTLLNCLLLDTYDTNKDIIFTILRTLSPRLLRLDEKEIVSEIIDTAVVLGNSIRPIDSSTAAYLFKLCLQSPVIKDLLNLRLKSIEFADDDIDAHLLLVIFLISRLEQPLKLARENIVRAAGKHSLYGYIYCLQSIIRDRNLQNVSENLLWRKTISNLVEMCFDLNAVVGQIVNNSSPEGHLPMDLNPHNCNSSLFNPESESDKITTPQMVLLCAWRTVKEVSLLFGYLTANLPIDQVDGKVGLLAEKQIILIGEHFVTLLSETKHRGAFEQAHVGFGQLCWRLWHLQDGQCLKQLPKIWLLQLLLAVTGLSPRDSKLCATRRSAGVPFMVQALLSSEESLTAVIKHGGSATFHSTMKILLALSNLTADEVVDSKMKSLIYDNNAFSELENHPTIVNGNIVVDEDENTKIHRLNEIKTHVLNILRALYRHSQLGECVKPYIADGVITAIKSYNGKTWAERNAATLLFSAMITRIFGVQRTKDHVNLSLHNKMTGKVFFERYPSLLGFMYAELESFVKPGDTLIKPGVQSVLLLLSRLYPGCHETADSNWKVAEFVSMVSKCAKSQVYETRELAARALVPLLTEITSRQMFCDLLRTTAMESHVSSNINLIHGYMLQLLQIANSSEFINFEPSSKELKNFIQNSNWILDHLENETYKVPSFPLATIYIQTLLQIYKVNRQWFSECSRDKEFDLFDKIRLHLEHGQILRISAGREVYEVTLTEFLTFWSTTETLCQNYTDSLSSYGKTTLTSWTPLLSHNNIDVQNVAWTKSKELVESGITSVFARLQLMESICKADEKMKDPIDDPTLEEALFEFLYVIFSNISNVNPFSSDPERFPRLIENVISHLTKKLHTEDYYVRDSFLRLIGAVYGKAANHPKEIVSAKDKRKIYELFFDNSWMDTCNNDCRLAVSQTIHNLYQSPMLDNDYFVLFWWTILLNLLIDDDRNVRLLASSVITKIDTPTEMLCDMLMRRSFFEKFTYIIGNKRPDVASAALFAWGVATWRDEDYEMDDTDVFNKCKNYECFEQLTISNLSIDSLKMITAEYRNERKLHPATIEWLKKIYDCDTSFETLSEFVKAFGHSIPTMNNKLDDYVDPTFCDKLQQALAYKRFQDSFIAENDVEVST